MLGECIVTIDTEQCVYFPRPPLVNSPLCVLVYGVKYAMCTCWCVYLGKCVQYIYSLCMLRCVLAVLEMLHSNGCTMTHTSALVVCNTISQNNAVLVHHHQPSPLLPPSTLNQTLSRWVVGLHYCSLDCVCVCVQEFCLAVVITRSNLASWSTSIMLVGWGE